jgi:hypothetical protein
LGETFLLKILGGPYRAICGRLYAELLLQFPDLTLEIGDCSLKLFDAVYLMLQGAYLVLRNHRRVDMGELQMHFGKLSRDCRGECVYFVRKLFTDWIGHVSS